MRRSFWLLAAVGAAVVLSGCHANGATFAVDSTADTVDVNPGDGLCDDGSGACSLRAAVMEANALPGVDKVQLAPGAVYSLAITGTGEDGAASGDLDITEGVDLEGDGSTIDAAGTDRIFDVRAPSGLVHVAGVTLTGGGAPDGAAIRQLGSATLLTTGVHVAGSTATAGAPVSATAGKLTMLLSTISGTAGTTAGAIEVTGPAAADLAGVTISGTTASGGGAIVNGTGATTKVDESTITANTTTTGALDDPGTGMTVLRSIVADQAVGPDCATTIASGGYNVASDSSCGFAGTDDQQGADADLGELLTGEGPVPVHVPGPSSAARDKAPAPCRASLDARLVTRPQGPACDSGAVEARSILVDDGGDSTDANPGDGTCDDGTGTCTLRAAITESNALPGTDHIVVNPAVTAITLDRAGDDSANAVGDLDVTDGLVIAGNGTTITQTTVERVLEVRPSATAVVLRDVTITGGDTAGSGGGITSAAPLTLERATVTGNLAGNRNGGGISAGAPLTVIDSTISANEAPDNGGGINAEGGLTLVNSTISGNTAGSNGGVRLFGQPAEIVHSTITANAGTGLAISSSLTMTATIVAGNGGNTCNGSGTSGGYNVAGDASCNGWLTATGDQTSADPLLGALADNGGPTLTHLPDAAGPAAGVVPIGTAGLCDGTIATDQRGTARPLGAACDAGAVEVFDAPTTLVVDDGGDSTDAIPGDARCDDGTGACTLRAAIMEANALAGAQTIDIGVPAVTLSLAGGAGPEAGDLFVTDSVVLEGNGATVTQTTGARVLAVDASAGSFAASDLTITGGNAPLGDGGGLYVKAPTTLTGVTITGNTGKNGGGVNISGGSLVIEDSTVSGNTAEDGGGLSGGPVDATNVTISGNTATAGTGGWRVGSGPSTLVHSTVVDNAGTTAANLRANHSTAPLELTASIVADPAAGPNCADVQFTSGGYNVVEGGSCAGLDITDVDGDPALGALADNGGPTLTHLPGIFSSAISAVPAGTAGLCDGTIANDQRGTARPQGPGCDAGAVERAAGYLTVDDGGDSTDAAPGDGTCDDGTGACTLRAAVMEADALAGAQRIHVAVPSVALSLTGSDATGGDLDVSDSLVIEGDGAAVTQTVSDRVLEATAGQLWLWDLTVTGGNATGPGGGLRLAGSSILQRVWVTGNTTTSGGGGIVHPGPLTVLDSTVSGNTAGSNGGGIAVNASLTMINSTVSGNTSTLGTTAGGGIATGSTGTVTLRSSTVVGNTGSNLRHATANTFDIGGSIIAGAATGSACTGGGTFTSSWFNIADGISCSFGGVGDRNSTNPLLGPLADNGGPTLTHLPGVGSPAIDAFAGIPGLCDGTIATDQRGTARPQGAACDIGSVEQ